jgi:peptidoglycan/LPS O-acetylase OafA/YrhL
VTVANYRYSTNFLRGAASLSVLIWHYQHFFYNDWAAFTIEDDWRRKQPFYRILFVLYENGYFAVQLFWCISGLVLCHAYISRDETNLTQYLTARFARLYPLHIFTLFVVVGLQILSKISLHSFQIYQANDLKNFLLNLGFIQSWTVNRELSFNAPTWSVSIEIAVYIIFYLSLNTLRKSKFTGSIIMLAVWTLVIHFHPSIFFAECLSYFLTGIAIWFATTKETLKNSIFFGAIASIISFLLLCKGSFNGQIAIVIVLVFLGSLLDRNPRILNKGHSKRFGDLTYSVFLWHTPIQILIVIAVLNFDVDRSLFVSPVFFVFYFSAVYLTAYFSFQLIETPMKKYLTDNILKSA